MKGFRNIIQGLLVCSGLLFCARQGRSQYVEVSASLDTNQVLIGDQFNFLISIIQPEGLLVEYPEFTDTIVNKVEILKRFAPDTVMDTETGQMEIMQRYLLTSFDSGLYVIPPVHFRFSAGNWSDSISANPVYLAVYSVPVDSAGRIFDIKQPMPSPVTLTELVPYILGGLSVLLVAAAMVYYLRRRKADQPIIPVSRPKESPRVVALRELDRLSGEKLWQRGMIKEYYTRLTQIIRVYIEEQFGIPAMEMTSNEILEGWKRSGKSVDGLYGKLKELLILADLVKFAREKPLPSFNESNLDRAFDFIRQTGPLAEQAEKPGSQTDDIQSPETRENKLPMTDER